MMGLIIGAVLAIFIADAIYARARTKLLTRVAHATRPRSREIIHRSPEGWRSLDTANARPSPRPRSRASAASTPFLAATLAAGRDDLRSILHQATT